MIQQRRFVNNLKYNQQGLASFVIVGVLVVLLALISIGFAKIMSRTQNNSLNNQLSTAANYAAQSEIKDVANYIIKNPDATSTTCTPADAGLKDIFKSGNLSADSAKTAAYTCLLVNPTPPDLVFKQIPPDQSQVINLTPTTSNRIDKIMLSWQGSAASNQNFPPDVGTGLIDETSWNNNGYTPVLRVTLYPVNSNNINPPAGRTFLFYPYSGKNPLNIAPQDYTNSDAMLVGVPCNNGTRHTGGFQGSADYACDIIIGGLAAQTSPAANADYFYARITPLYAAGDVKIKANYTPGVSPITVAFKNDQAVVDVTAKDGSAVKRLQGRVCLSGSSSASAINCTAPGAHNIPEFGLQSSNAICKRLTVSPTNITISGPAACQSQSPIQFPPAPVVTLTANPTIIKLGDSSTLSWTSTNATSCAATSPVGWTAKTTTNDNQSVTPASAGTTTYVITCTGPGGSSPPAKADVTVFTPGGGGGGGGGGLGPCSLKTLANDNGDGRAVYDYDTDGCMQAYLLYLDSTTDIFPNSWVGFTSSNPTVTGWFSDYPHTFTIRLRAFDKAGNLIGTSTATTPVAPPPLHIDWFRLRCDAGCLDANGTYPSPSVSLRRDRWGNWYGGSCPDNSHTYNSCQISWQAHQFGPSTVTCQMSSNGAGLGTTHGSTYDTDTSNHPNGFGNEGWGGSSFISATVEVELGLQCWGSWGVPAQYYNGVPYGWDNRTLNYNFKKHYYTCRATDCPQ